MSTDALRVRAAVPEDLERLVEANRGLARETEGRELDAQIVTRGVRAVLDDSNRGEYRIAEWSGNSVGSLLVTREWSDWRDGWFWWIQSVYVDSAGRGQGVFRALYDDVLERARAASGVCGVRLYVERENDTALRVYEAVGMTRTSYRLFEVDFVLG